MSANSNDTFPKRSDEALRFDPSMLPQTLGEPDDRPDPTEELANDVTSDLTPIRLLPDVESRLEVACGSVLRERYVLEQQLGNGGTAMIFRAVDLRRDPAAADGQRVVIKVLRPEFRDRPHSVDRLQREFRQTQALLHPGIVRFHDLDCDRGTWFIVMELLEGETLGPRLRRTAPLPIPVEESIRIAAATAEALAFAHERGVTHGDVKPDNIFVTSTGAVKMLDFGIALESPAAGPAESFAAPNSAVPAATRAYASPQVLAGEPPKPCDDVFSLACVIYEMVAGRHPYGRRGADVARDSRMTIEPPFALASAQWAVLAAGLSWRREERPDIRALVRGLRVEQPAQESLPKPVAAPEPIAGDGAPRRLQGRWQLVAAVGLAFILGVAISRFATQSPPPQAVIARTTPDSQAEKLPSSTTATTTPNQSAVGPESIVPFADEPPADLPQPVPTTRPGLIAFDVSSMVVSSRAVVAAIPVRHFTTERRRVEVAWRATDGSAVAGRDYGGPQSGVAAFTEGHTFRIIYVPITVAKRVTGDRAFTVELTNASPGVSLGMMRRIVVTILDDA